MQEGRDVTERLLDSTCSASVTTTGPLRIELGPRLELSASVLDADSSVRTYWGSPVNIVVKSHTGGFVLWVARGFSVTVFEAKTVVLSEEAEREGVTIRDRRV